MRENQRAIPAEQAGSSLLFRGRLLRSDRSRIREGTEQCLTSGRHGALIVTLLALRERYGVEINPVAGCVVTKDLVWYVDGYNSVARPRIVARHSKDIFAECAAEARVAWEQAHPRE